MDARSSLQEKWEELFNEVGAEGDPAEFYKKLEGAYSEENRSHRTLQLVNDTLDGLEQVKEEVSSLNELKMALWFQDYSFDPRSKNNEIKSARGAADMMYDMGLEAEFQKNVVELVIATR